MTITDHAYKRAKERTSWNRGATDRMAERALREGLAREETTGKLRQYVGSQWKQGRGVYNLRIYGETIFFFDDTRLVTVCRLPNEYVKIARKINERRKNECLC